MNGFILVFFMILIHVIEVRTPQHVGLLLDSFEVENLPTVDVFVGLEGCEANPLPLIPGMMNVLLHEGDSHLGKGI